MKLRIFMGLLMISLGIFGFLSGSKNLHKLKKNPSKISCVKGIHPEKEFPLSENKSFVIVIYAHNAAFWCEKALQSVFEQEYDRYRIVFIDDSSSDHTFEKIQQYIIANHQDQRVIAIQNESYLGFVGSLYRAIEHCRDREILLLLDAQNWLSSDNVLNSFNLAYQNPDVWAAFGSFIEYPSYQIVHPIQMDCTQIEKKEFSIQADVHCPSISFYASLLKAIEFSDLLIDDRGAQTQNSFITAILQQTEGRFCTICTPTIFLNHSLARRNFVDYAKQTTIQSKPSLHLLQRLLHDN